MEEIKNLITPITFVDTEEYSATEEDTGKVYYNSLNELFTSPYNINYMFMPNTVGDAYFEMTKEYTTAMENARNSYLLMNIEDLVVSMIHELLNDIRADNDIKYDIIKKYIVNDYIQNVIRDHTKEIRFIDVTLSNIYTDICLVFNDICRDIASTVTSKQCKSNDLIAETLYRSYVDDDRQSYERIKCSKGNSYYAHIVALLRDIVDMKLAVIRRLMENIKQTYANMTIYANFNVDKENGKIVPINDEYYNYLINDKFNITSEDNNSIEGGLNNEEERTRKI